MPGLIINGAPESVPGLACANFFDDPALRLSTEDRSLRPLTWIRGIVLHTTSGLPKDLKDPRQYLRVGKGPSTRAAKRINGWWKDDGRCAGSHLMVDFDGSVSQLADLQLEITFHAGPVNPVTIGIEIVQDPQEAFLYDGQLNAVLDLVDWLTRRFKIQRQIPTAYRGKPLARLVGGGEDVVGVYGHRDVTHTRGQGDPGDFIFEKLLDAGYETMDFGVKDDLRLWSQRQREYGLFGDSADGIPGPETAKVLEAGGLPHGLWSKRPGDT